MPRMPLLEDASLATVIVNYRAGALICQHLLELVDLHAPAKWFHIYVVDNNSSNDDAKLLAEFIESHQLSESVTLIAHAHNNGFGAGNNVALRQIQDDGFSPDYVFFLNPDAQLRTTCLEHLCATLHQQKNAGFAGARLEDDKGNLQASAFRFFSVASEFESTVRTRPFSILFSNAIVARQDLQETIQVDWVSGAAFMARYDVLVEIGWFDEDFFLYFEETDLMKRALLAGWQTWHVHDANALHIEGFSTGNKGDGDVSILSDHWLTSRRLYYRKHHSGFAQILADIAWQTGTFLYGMRRLLTGRNAQSQWKRLQQFRRHKKEF